MANKQKWIFTFGYGHSNAGHYVVIEGTMQEAREQMFKTYGSKWCAQYSEAEVKRFKEQGIFRETEIPFGR